MVLPTEFISNHHKGTGLYVDVENLGDDAEILIETLLNAWPAESAPKPSLVNLYVKADTTELWKTWALQHISSHSLNVHGIQHFTGQQSKNSADMAIAVDAISDFLHGVVSHVAVYSDDSDFISLFSKIRSEALDSQIGVGCAPFLWILTNRPGKRTPNIDRFFPPENLHQVSVPVNPKPSESVSPQDTAVAKEISDSQPVSQSKPTSESIAMTLLKELPIGPFKSTDCKPIIKRQFSSHSLAKSPSDAKFGDQFSKTIWPYLEKRGVKLTRQKPRRYEMTQAAKNSLPQ